MEVLFVSINTIKPNQANSDEPTRKSKAIQLTQLVSFVVKHRTKFKIVDFYARDRRIFTITSNRSFPREMSITWLSRYVTTRICEHRAGWIPLDSFMRTFRKHTFFLIYLGIDLLDFFLGLLLYKCHHMFDLQHKYSKVFYTSKHVHIKGKLRFLTLWN